MNILDLSSKANTYKFAFIRFLLQYSNKHTKTHVDFSTIAEYFLEYYWVQACKSKLKQSPQIDEEPIIIKIIQEEFDVRDMTLECETEKGAVEHSHKFEHHH